MKRPTVQLVAATAACLVGFLVWSQFPDRQSSAPAFGDFAQASSEARSDTPDKQSAASDDPSSTRKPVVVVSIAGYDQLLDDVGFIGKLA
jgi:hypothetical protein